MIDYRWQEALEGLEAHLKGKDKGDGWLAKPGPGQDKVSAEVLGERLPQLYAALGREANRGTVVGVESWIVAIRPMHDDGQIVAAIDGVIANAEA